MPRSPILTHVVRTEALTPRMVRVVLGGDGLAGFGAGEFTDHYVKLQLPPAGAPYGAPFDPEAVKAERPREQWPRVRTYSVRAFDRDARELTIDFVAHGDSGVAGPWARAARPGDALQLLGPGGAYAPDPAAAAHLLVGDPSVLPAIAAALERIPAGVPTHVLVQVADAQDELPLRSPGDLRVRWLHERGDHVLVDAVRALELPAGVQVFVHGEAAAVRALRAHLLGERGLDREGVSISGYWKRTRTEEGWREDKQEWLRQAEADLSELPAPGNGAAAPA